MAGKCLSTKISFVFQSERDELSAQIARLQQESQDGSAAMKGEVAAERAKSAELQAKLDNLVANKRRFEV